MSNYDPDHLIFFAAIPLIVEELQDRRIFVSSNYISFHLINPSFTVCIDVWRNTVVNFRGNWGVVWSWWRITKLLWNFQDQTSEGIILNNKSHLGKRKNRALIWELKSENFTINRILFEAKCAHASGIRDVTILHVLFALDQRLSFLIHCGTFLHSSAFSVQMALCSAGSCDLRGNRRV